MYQIALIDEQIRAGQKVVERLKGEGIPVSAAAWINEAESGKWYFYLVTSMVRKDGAKMPAYRRVSPVIRQVQEEGFLIDLFEVKVIGPANPTSVAMMDAHKGPNARRAIRYQGASLGRLSVEEAYIYPPLVADTY